MKILVTMTDLRVGGGIPLQKGLRYVTSDNVAGALASAAPGLIRLVADATAYTRPWRGEDLAGKTLLVYRALGLGDEFLAARLCEIAKRRHNAAAVQFACFENHHPIWAHEQTPFDLLPSIVPWDVWTSAAYHVIGEHWWESLGTVDQPDCFDVIANVCGIEIPKEDRLPLIPTPPAEVLAKTAEHIAKRFEGRPLVLWQLAATSRIRSYPPDQTRKTMSLVLEKTDAAIVAIGHPAQIAAYEIQEDCRLAIYSAGIPGLIALTAAAAARTSCVVAPDSVLGHIAAAYPALPVISLWSSFDPARRVASYPNHRPIYSRIKCSPCWSHEHAGDPLQYKGCPLTSCNDHCAGLRIIPPAQIARAVCAILSPSTAALPETAASSPRILRGSNAAEVSLPETAKEIPCKP